MAVRCSLSVKRLIIRQSFNPARYGMQLQAKGTLEDYHIGPPPKCQIFGEIRVSTYSK